MIKMPFIEIPLEIEVLTPVHIGMGEDYVPTDYVIKNDKLFVVDRDKFTAHLMQFDQRWKEFGAVCRGSGANALMEIKKIITREFEDTLSSYVVTHVGALHTTKEYPEIARIIRTAFYNEPILPGSTVKGAFMTAFVNSGISRFYLDNYSNNLKHDIQHDMPNVIGQMISVSDFDVIGSLDCCGIKTAHYSHQKPAKPKQLGNLEYVIKNTKFVGKVRLTRLIGGYSSKYKEITGKDVDKFSNDFFEYLNDFYAYDVKVKETKELYYDGLNFDLPDKSPGTAFFKLGLHSGAYSRTLHPDQEITVKNRSNREKIQTTIWTIDNLPMAWCAIKAIDESSYRDYRKEVSIRRENYEDQLHDSRRLASLSMEKVRARHEEEQRRVDEGKKLDLLKKQEAELEKKKLDDMSDFDRLIYQISHFDSSETNINIVMNEFNKIDAYKENNKTNLAKAIKDYFCMVGKWAGKLSDKQQKKVDKIKSILQE